jgi:hypothetical protein
VHALAEQERAQRLCIPTDGDAELGARHELGPTPPCEPDGRAEHGEGQCDERPDPQARSEMAGDQISPNRILRPTSGARERESLIVVRWWILRAQP